jgi:hypothetical protein
MGIPFSQVKPTALKLKSAIALPAKIEGADSVSVSRANGVVTIGSDYGSLIVADTIPNPNTGYFKGWDPVNGFYRVSYSTITAGSAAAAATSTAAAATATSASATATAANNSAQAALATAQAIATANALPVNHLSNSGFQLCAGLALQTKFNSFGTGTLATFAVTSVSYAAPVLPETRGYVTINITPSASNEIKPNFLVQLSGAGIDAALKPIQAGTTGAYTALRVISTTGSPVSSFKVLAPLGVTSFSASSGTGTVVTPGDIVGTSGNGPSNWKKLPTAALLWMENDPVNFDPIGGSTQVVGMRQTSSAETYFYQTLPAARTKALQGQKISAGGRMMQKISTGTGTGRYFIQTDGTFHYGNTVALSVGTYQWSGVQNLTIPAGTSSIVEGFAMNDAAGAVFYFSKPCGIESGYIPNDYYSAPQHEMIYPPGIFNVWSIYGKTFTVPTTTLGSTPFYGFYIDLMGETAGQVHWSADMLIGDMEGQSASLPATVITANTADNLGIPGGAILWMQAANQTNALTIHQPLTNGMMFIAAGQSGKTFSQFNVDLYGIATNTAQFQ